jgi:uncharacterized RDD family membrane protein YckC
MSPDAVRAGRSRPSAGPESDDAAAIGPERLWFFGEEGRPSGPVPEGVLRRMIRSVEVPPATRVWTDGLAAWIPAFVVSELVPGPAALDAESLGAWSPRTRLVRRVCARLLDTLLAVAGGALAGTSLAAVLDEPHWKVFAAAGAFSGPLFYAFVEALALARWGTSPGKALCALRVRTERQARPPFVTAAQRSLLVWWHGLGAGIPLLTPFTAATSLRGLWRRGVARWDRVTRLVVEQRAFRAARQGLVVEDSTR